MTELNLLVVDWDFFLPNPALSAEPSDDVALYLWEQKEAPFYLSPLYWGSKAAAFWRNGRELPQVADWETFWDRFTFSGDGVTVLYGDSNVHAGRIHPSSLGLGGDVPYGVHRWSTVSLWDAHHDSGYNNTGSFEEWQARGMLTCEDWMLAHHERGSRVEVIYPAWRKAVGTVEPEPRIPVDRRVDDGTDPDTVYHAVYVCRSGAWVPPWCDEQFSAFLNLAPDSWPTLVEADRWEHPRPDGLDLARNELAVGELLGKMTSDRAGKGDTACTS